MDGQVSLYTDALGLAVWILNALDGAAALQHDGQVARGKDARADMIDGIRAVDGGVLQGQGAVAVVVDIVVVCAGHIGGQGAVGVGCPVAGTGYRGATHGEGGRCRRRSRDGGQQPQAQGQDAEDAQNASFHRVPPFRSSGGHSCVRQEPV